MRPPRGIWAYLLWQLPGWVFVSLLLVLLIVFVGLPAWVGVLMFCLVLAKDLVLFPVMKDVFSPSAAGRDRLVGRRGRALEEVAPTGYVQVGGELWRAEAQDREKPIPAGSHVVVLDARGLTLIVDEEDVAR